MDMRDLPPDVRAAIDRTEQFNRQIETAQAAQRRQTLAFSWLLCACRPWYDRAAPGIPPQADCPVHGTVMVTLSGEVL